MENIPHLWVPKSMAPQNDVPLPLPSHLVTKLSVPLPREAVKPHPTKKFLSTIKVIYVVERLNEVFGVNGWKVTNEVIENSAAMVVIKSTLTVPEYGIYVEQFGGNDNVDRGDAYKGACTDALSKIGSYLGVGMDVYKGLADAPAATPPAAKGDRFYREPEPAPSKPAAKKPAGAELGYKDRLATTKQKFCEFDGGESAFLAVLGRNGYDEIGSVKEQHFEQLLQDLRVAYRQLEASAQNGRAA
jgi:Rad52/22 family double-strand break repair protein